MKNFFCPLLLVLLSALFSACSIQKRQHMPGYHVTWNKTQSKVDKNQKPSDPLPEQTAESIPKTEDKSTQQAQDDKSLAAKNTSDVSVIPGETKSIKPKKDQSFKSKFSTFGYRNFAKIKPDEDATPPETIAPYTEPTAIIALILAIAGWLALIASSSGALFGVLGLLLLSAAFILSIIAIKFTRNNGTDGLGMAIVALVLSGLFLILFILVFVWILTLIGPY